MSRTRAKFDNQTLGYQYGNETVMRLSPVQFYDDFLGQYTGTYFHDKFMAVDGNAEALWGIVQTNLNADIAAVQNAANGIVRIIVDADNNAEQGLLYFADNLQFRLTQGLIFECRAALSTLPTTVAGAGTFVTLGMASATNADPDAVAVNAWFRLQGTADILWETDDNVAVDDDDNDTGVNATAGVYRIYRIDCTDWTTPKFFIDGALVGTGNMAALAAPSVQPYMQAGKLAAATTSLGTLDIDYIRVWQNRS